MSTAADSRYISKRDSSKEGHDFLISFVIPVYNVELYLRDTIESLLSQTIGFEENCEIILVNDGSTDGSEEVCLSYKEKYPNNITYIKQDNSGPGEARNRGFELARGKYVNPIDSDDRLSKDAAEEVYKFFEEHQDEIDVVGIKWELFEARRGGHPLNHKFTSDRIIDLNKDYTKIQSSVAPAFFKREALEGHRFDSHIGRYAEDGRFMGEFMMRKEKIGVVVRPTYYYRKRLDQTSSQDKNQTDKFWYLETPKRAWYDLVKYAKAKTGGSIPKYVQYLIMYDLQWRFNQAKQEVLDESEAEEYKSLLYGLLQYIDDEVIVSTSNIGIDHKLFVLSKKHETDITGILRDCDKVGNKYLYKGTCVYDVGVDKPTTHIEILECKDDQLVIEGYYTGYLEGDSKLEFNYGKKKYTPRYLTKQAVKKKFLGETIIERQRFTTSMTIDAGNIVIHASDQCLPSQLYFHRHSHLSHNTARSYKLSGSNIVSRSSDSILIKPYSLGSHVAAEAQYLMLTAKRLRIKPFFVNFRRWKGVKRGESGIIPEDRWVTAPLRSAVLNTYTIAFRLLHYILRFFRRREIWLISDRIMAADDSGEILFRYIMEHQKDKNIKAYFTISKKSEQYQDIAKIGPTIHFGGLRHKLLFLLSDKVISSEATDAIINIFGWKIHSFVDLYTFDFVFLQHGIIRDDISNWLNKYNKNIKMFVTSAKPEYKSIVEGAYMYDEGVVKLTGLPRYDNLHNKPKNKIMIMPTWRDNLAGKVDFKTGLKEYNPDFTKSEYYHFFHSLMNHDRLLEAMKRLDIVGEFYIHPSFENQTDDFKGNDAFTIMRMPHNYPKAKSEAKLMITDYSSVAFDFAYLRKPVLYSQFDIDKFYSLHTSENGYFTYEDDGFGPVVRTLEETVDETIRILENDCKMSRKYQSRVEKFFAFNDKNNSARVYEEIRKI